MIFRKSGNNLLLSLCEKGYFLFTTNQFLHLHKMLCTTFVRRHKSQGLLKRHLQGWVYSERWWTRWIASPVFCSDNLNLGSSCLSVHLSGCLSSCLSVSPSVPMRGCHRAQIRIKFPNKGEGERGSNHLGGEPPQHCQPKQGDSMP